MFQRNLLPPSSWYRKMETVSSYKILNLFQHLCIKPKVKCRKMREKEGKQRYRRKQEKKEKDGRKKRGKGQIKQSQHAVCPSPTFAVLTYIIHKQQITLFEYTPVGTEVLHPVVLPWLSAGLSCLPGGPCTLLLPEAAVVP